MSPTPLVHAELVVRHTRRTMPTRRVALGTALLPMSGTGLGGVLLGAVVHHRIDSLDDDQIDLIPGLLHEAAGGLSIPGIALWFRMQTDVQGLDRSRHRVVEEDGTLIVELDVHGAATPQIVGAIMAAASLPPTPRVMALQTISNAVEGRFRYPRGILVRRLVAGIPAEVPWAPGVTWKRGKPSTESAWEGIDSQRRWAMNVLGCEPEFSFDRDDVNKRFRTLLREAHPDSGGSRQAAAERIAELSEARELLFFELDGEEVASLGFVAGE
jgi:hypothetical protein